MAFHHYPPHTFHQRTSSQHTQQPHHYHYSISRSPSSSPPHSMNNSPHIHRSPHLYPSSLSSSSLTSRRRSSSSLSSSLPMRSHSTSTLSTGEDTPNISSSSPQSMLRSIDTSIPTSTIRITSTPIPTHHRSQVMNKPTTHAPSSAPTQTSSSSTSATIIPSTSAPQSSTPDLLSQTLHIMSQHQDELSSRLLSLHEHNKYKKQKIATLQSQYTLLQPSTHAPSLSITSCDDDENDYVVVNGCTDSEDDITLHNYCNTTYTCAAVAQDALRTMMSTYLHHIHQAETLSSQLDDEISCYQQKLHGMKLRMKCMGTLHHTSCKIPEYQMHIDNMKQTANQRQTLRTTPAPS